MMGPIGSTDHLLPLQDSPCIKKTNVSEGPMGPIRTSCSISHGSVPKTGGMVSFVPIRVNPQFF